MAKNNTLRQAKSLKKDEYYTRYCDVEEELIHYEEQFKNKTILCECGAKEQYTVYCNCDHPSYSNFFEFFCRHAIDYNIKSVWATWYDPDINPETGSTYAVNFKYPKDANPNDYNPNNWKDYLKKFEMPGNGDFRSKACIKILQGCDICVTNPPFSIFREFIDTMIKYDKKFLVIGNMNCFTYKEIFKLIKEDKIWCGYRPLNTNMYYKVPEDYKEELLAGKEGSTYKIIDGEPMAKMRNTCWMTNLEVTKRNERIELQHKIEGHEDEYPQYDNYLAYECSKLCNLPNDSEDKILGLPITFIGKYNPRLFEIIGLFGNYNIETINNNPCLIMGESLHIDSVSSLYRGPVVNNKPTYSRILIRRRPEDIERYGNR